MLSKQAIYGALVNICVACLCGAAVVGAVRRSLGSQARTDIVIGRTIELPHGMPTLGNQSAKVILIEFSDFQCPFCGKYTRDSWPRIKSDHVDTARVRYAFVSYPLEAIHPFALAASNAAACAGSQGRYWDMHDVLFAHQLKLTHKDLLDYGKDLGFNPIAFETCLREHNTEVTTGIELGKMLGVQGTPTFIIADVIHSDTLRIRTRVIGADVDGLQRALVAAESHQ